VYIILKIKCILYSDEQLTDLKHLCCTGTSILGVDKTFNHVTATCYKQKTVVKDSTGEEPIFLGPMFIHDNSDYESFRLHVPKDKNTVTSTDGTTTVIPPRIIGKKIGQRTRKINERTTSFKKCKQNDD
jgi:hypothetical protein